MIMTWVTLLAHGDVEDEVKHLVVLEHEPPHRLLKYRRMMRFNIFVRKFGRSRFCWMRWIFEMKPVMMMMLSSIDVIDKKRMICIGVSDGYKKVNGQWLISHEHVSVPVNFATMKPDINAK